MLPFRIVLIPKVIQRLKNEIIQRSKFKSFKLIKIHLIKKAFLTKTIILQQQQQQKTLTVIQNI